MKALVIGATGAVGKDLVEQLLKDDSFERVDVFVRREMPLLSSKLVSHVVDFDHPEIWAELLTGDVLFSCLGTTIKAAGSQDAQWKVDYTYQYDAARAARANGVRQYILVSSVGADAKSKIFYSRMKGQLDEDVEKLGFPGCFILRPPSLIRKGSDRFGEKAGVVVLKALNAIGLMRSWTPMPTEEVAAAMVRLAKSGKTGHSIITSQEIRIFA
ncbi:MAG: NAD(P)H-binding protein [Bacteroidales bacterium]|nr:NAD(P)H-binding protein [Bacteroidales bacterium]